MEMEILRRLGLEKDWLYESIVTTRIDGRVNQAPMGVWTSNLKSVKLEVYRGTKTCAGILQNRGFVINFPDKVVDFYRSMFNKEAAGGDSLCLDNCSAALEMQVSGMRDVGNKVEFTAEIISARIKENPRLINRAEYLALDSLIAYSKLSSVSEGEEIFLRKKIRENHRIICKTAPQSEFQVLVQHLLEKIL